MEQLGSVSEKLHSNGGISKDWTLRSETNFSYDTDLFNIVTAVCGVHSGNLGPLNMFTEKISANITTTALQPTMLVSGQQ